MEAPICKLEIFTNGIAFESAQINRAGKLEPKDGHTYRILLQADNPDISNLKLEVRLIRQALKEYEKRLPYNFKVYSQLPWPITLKQIDVTISWIETDSYMTDNTLAYAGYPFGSLRGIMRFNNKYAWLDGYGRTGKRLRELGIILPGMKDDVTYRTYSVRQTVKHEFGHILGLEHDPTNTGVMSAIYDFTKNMLSKFSLTVLEDKYGLRNVVGRWLHWIKAVMTRQVKF